MNRRQFIIGSFMAGLLTTVGIKPKEEALIYFKPDDYMKTADFKFEGGPATVRFFVFNQAHTEAEQEIALDWINGGPSDACPLPGLVVYPAKSC